MLTLQGRTADFRVGDSCHRQNWVYVLSLEGDAGETATLDDGSIIIARKVVACPRFLSPTFRAIPSMRFTKPKHPISTAGSNVTTPIIRR